jgi:hypothetical protein
LRRAALADYDPLPTEQQERENKAEIEPDWTAGKGQKKASTVR